MNIGKRKLLRICQVSLISLAVCFSLAGCDTKKLDVIDSDRDTIVSYEMAQPYGYAVGLNYIYILYGKYKSIRAGLAIGYKNKTLHTFRIRDLLERYPILQNKDSLAAADLQDKKNPKLR